MTTNNLQYLKGFFEACYGQKQSVTFDSDKVADILDRINGAITEATTPDKVIPAIQPVQIPLPFPAVPFKPYQPMPGITPFYPVQPTVTPNEPINRPLTNPWETPQWPGINDEQKYRWGVTCETIGPDIRYGVTGGIDGMVCRDPFELDASTLSAYHDPLPAVSADKLAAIMRDESRAQKLEERKARSAERTANWGRPLTGHARD